MQKVIAVNAIIYLLIVQLISGCAGTSATGNEAWTLVELVTQGENIKSITDTVEVRNCCDLVENKTVSCSAGTSNDFSIDIGGSFGNQAISFDPSVGVALGFNRNSGESLELPTAPSGYIYQYRVTTTYSITSGEAIIRSSNGQEKKTSYRFQSKCSLKIEPDRESISCNESCSSQPLTQITPFVITPTSQTIDNNLVFAENFEDYDLKDSWTDGGGKWSFVLDESGNVVYDIENSSSIWAGYNFGKNNWQNYKVVYRTRLLKTGKEAPLNLDFRLVSDANWYSLLISPEDNKVIKSVNSKVSELEYTSFDFPPTIWHTVRLEVFDTNIRVYIDDQIMHSITDSSLSNGRLAFSIGPGTHAQFDDIIVTSIGK